MALKTIAVDAEAYSILAKAKKQGESFSDVVKRTVRPRRPISDFAGAWKDMSDEEWTRVRRNLAEGRQLDAARLKRLDALWKS